MQTMEPYNFATSFSPAGVPVPRWVLDQRFNVGFASNTTGYDDADDSEFDSDNWDDDDSDENISSTNTSMIVASSPSTPSSASATTTWGSFFTFSPITPSTGFTLSIRPSTASPKTSPALTSFPTIGITLHSHKSKTPVVTTSWNDCELDACHERGHNPEECTSAMKRCSLYSTVNWETATAPGTPSSATNECLRFKGVDCSSFDDVAVSVAGVLNQKRCATGTTTPTSIPDACKSFHGVDCSKFDDAASSASCVFNQQKCATMTSAPSTRTSDPNECDKYRSVTCDAITFPQMSAECVENQKKCADSPDTNTFTRATGTCKKWYTIDCATVSNTRMSAECEENHDSCSARVHVAKPTR